ncbi:hypothetical protein SAMN05660816_05573 [Niastella yeongjuensis]|nr:hypothetical protein SAMN05660816_05573 [Niastella yeongjuensis]
MCSAPVIYSQINKILSQTETTSCLLMRYLTDYECIEMWHFFSNLLLNDTCDTIKP